MLRTDTATALSKPTTRAAVPTAVTRTHNRPPPRGASQAGQVRGVLGLDPATELSPQTTRAAEPPRDTVAQTPCRMHARSTGARRAGAGHRH